MKPERIKEVIQEKVKEVSKHCGRIGRDFDKETIHKFRVSVKTLRSFLRLLRTGSKEPYAKLPGKFKRLYQVAGAIRDAQLELEKLEIGSDLPVYTQKLRNDIERCKKEWNNHYSKKLMVKLKKRLSNYHLVSLNPQVLTDFFAIRIEAVATCAKTKSPSNAQVHEMRKQLKDLVYTSKLAKKEWRTAYERIKRIPVKTLDNLTADIGEYNDARLTYEHLNSFASPQMEITERKAIHQICKAEKTKLKARKKSVLADVKQLIDPLLVG